MPDDTTISDGFKRCTGCKETKRLNEFYKNRHTKDGYANECKTCSKARVKRWQQQNPERERERVTQWKKNNPERDRELARNRARIRRKANPEREREWQKQWRQENPDKVREKYRKWYDKNKDKQREYDRKRRQSNPELGKKAVRARRARKRQIRFVEIPNMEEILFDVQNGCCLYCGSELLNGYQIDHIVPLALIDLLQNSHPGHIPSNLTLTCSSCNHSKSDIVLEEWLAWKYPEQMDEILHRVERHIQIMKEWE